MFAGLPFGHQGTNQKQPKWVDAYVHGEYCAQILANSTTNWRTSRVWRDPLSRLDLTAATQQPAAAQQQQQRLLARPVPSAGAADHQWAAGAASSWCWPTDYGLLIESIDHSLSVRDCIATQLIILIFSDIYFDYNSHIQTQHNSDNIA